MSILDKRVPPRVPKPGEALKFANLMQSISSPQFKEYPVSNKINTDEAVIRLRAEIDSAKQPLEWSHDVQAILDERDALKKIEQVAKQVVEQRATTLDDWVEFKQALDKLEKAKQAKIPRPFRVGDVTETRNGTKARIICVDRKNTTNSIVVLLEQDGMECAEYRDVNGQDLSTYDRTGDLIPLYEEDNRCA